MRITILGGSPKGEKSVTLQYLIYIQKHFPGHTCETFHIGQKIKGVPRDQ